MSEADPGAVAVFLSGRGGNLQALLKAGLPIGLVVSDTSTAGGLVLARRSGVATAVLEPTAFPSAQACDAALSAVVEAYQCRLVVLAGYMRILGTAFCTRFAGRVINLHPSLLPALPGRETHARALAQGDNQHGCSVHWVTEQVDAGPVIRQATVAVRPDDDVSTLARRVQVQEHQLLPAVVRDILAGTVVAP